VRNAKMDVIFAIILINAKSVRMNSTCIKKFATDLKNFLWEDISITNSKSSKDALYLSAIDVIMILLSVILVPLATY
jgi:hypothetical protein